MDILPDELCQEIFAHLAGYNQQFDFVRPNLPGFSDVIRAPFRVAATCTRWRKLVVNSPELWAFVHACDDRPIDDAHLRVCIERSGQHPLDVWIHSSGIERSDDDTDGEGEDEHEGSVSKNLPGMFFEWLDLVQSNAHRWRRVRIDFPQPTHISKFDSFTKPMPFLEHLVISTSDLAGLDGYMVNTDWESNPKRFYFQGCPNLHTLASHATLMVPATTLRRLKCLHFGVRGLNSDAPLWAALAMTPALEELHMYYPFRSRSSLLAEPPSNPVSLPALRRLGLLGFYHFEHKRWDKYLNVPNVDTLVVSVEPLNHLRDVFATFSPSVRHLILTTVEPQGEGGAFFSYDDATALDGLQRIETLELRDITPSMLQQEPQVFFGSLAGIGDNRDGPVPKWGPTLRKLIFRDCEVNLGDCASLVSLVHMRVTAVQDNVEDAFELQLINTRFLKGPWGEVPGLMGPVKHLFESSIVERRHPSEDAYYDNFEDLLEDVDYQHLSDAEYNEDGKPDATFEDAGPQPDGLSLETSEEQYVEQFGADSPKKHLSP